MTAFTNNTFHNSQILLSDKVKRYASWSSHTVYGCAIALSLSTFVPSHVSQKLVNVASAIALFSVSNRLDRLAMYASGYGSISEAQSHIQYRAWLDASLQPPKREVTITQPEIVTPVKFADIREALKKPHIMLLGETGSGKSVLCKYFASELKIPCIALDPHANPNDWQGAKVIGRGRDYPAIGKELEILVQLMDVRYKQRDQGRSQFAPLGVILDEFPAVASSLGKGAADPVKLIVREARKVNIKLILLAQGSEVKTLGIEGEGSLRESFAVVSLGKFAVDRAKGLKDKNIIEAIANQSRPAMIDDQPSTIPTIPDTVTLPVLPLPDDYLALQQPLDVQMLNSGLSPNVASALSGIQIAPVFQKIIGYLDGRDWKKDYEIKAGIREFKDADTNLKELQTYLQWLELQGYIETRSTQRGALEARSIQDKTV